MKFGYMAGFRSDLVSEIEFAKNHFDFIEITIQPDLLNFINIPILKETVGDLTTIGHIHWEIADSKDISKNISLLKDLGCQKITMHPFEKLSMQENADIFNKLVKTFSEKGISLLIENVSASPYNSADAIYELLSKVPGANFTFDMGHANKISEADKYINLLKTRIRHIHLHDNISQADHLFFEDQARLNNMLEKIKGAGYDDTILMETFSVIKNNQRISLEFPEIKKLHIEQLKTIANFL